MDGLELFGMAKDADAIVAVLCRLAVLMPRATLDRDDGARVRRDGRLERALARLAQEARACSAASRGAALWSLGMIYPRGARGSATDLEAARWLSAAIALADALSDDDVVGLPAHEATAAVWGCETIGVPPSAALTRRAQEVPFKLHVGAVTSELSELGAAHEPSAAAAHAGGDAPSAAPAASAASAASAAVASLAAELPLRRDVVASGSASPSVSELVEDRDTCWFSDGGTPFAYSGKVMAADGRLSGGVAAVRDAVHAALGHWYDSVLVNHYPDGGSGMRFHSDPGQGEAGGWGFSTAVVSVGETRLFTFRRTAQPQTRVTFAVRHGDVLHMFGACQEQWQHSVLRERVGAAGPGGGGGAGGGAAANGAGAARISLVFKRTLASEREGVHRTPTS